EPRMRAALADAAVRGHVLVGRHTLVAVELLQLVRALESAVVAHGRGPRNGLRSRDVPASLRTFLLVAGRRDQIAGELLRAAHVDERARIVAEPGEHVVAERPDRRVALARAVGRRLARRN